MDGRRTALIVASDEFEHSGLKRLRAPAADARALAEVLGDREVGDFKVRIVHNEPSHVVQGRVEDLFADSQPDDLVLLHFSGHGIKNDSGELFLATQNTRPDRLASTAVSADFVQRCIRSARAHSIVLFLDCCYGGAFGQGVTVRASGPANVLENFPAGKLGGGRGRAVITASSAMEYAFEGSTLADAHQEQPSIFTSALVEGLASGEADRDEDGLISLNELYDYVFDRVREETPHQTPGRDVELQGELYLAKSRRRRVRAMPLPPDVEAALKDTNMYTRLGAVSELGTRLASEDLGIALGAHEALSHVVRSDIHYVSQSASQALTTARPAASPSELEFGEVTLGSAPPTIDVALHGLPIATAAAVVADAEWLVVDRHPGGVRVSVVATDEGEYAGTLTVTSPGGEVVPVPVTARIVRGSAAAASAPPGASGAPTADAAAEAGSPPVAAPAVDAGIDLSGRTNTAEPTAAGLADTSSTPDGDTRRLPTWCGGAALGAGFVTGLSAARHYSGDTATWDLIPEIRAALLGVAALGLFGGICALWLRARPEVGSGLLVGVAPAALLDAVGLLGDSHYSLSSRQEGWYLAVAGCLTLCAAGIGALISSRKAQVLVQTRGVGRYTRWTLWGWATLCSVSLIVMGALAVDGSEDEVGSMLIVYGVAALAVPGTLLRITPRSWRNWALVGWALAALGPLLSLWNILNGVDERTWGMPVAIIAGLVIPAVPMLQRRPKQGD